MRSDPVETLRRQTRDALEAVGLTGDAAALNVQVELLQAIELVIVQAARLSDTIFRPAEEDRPAIEAALAGMDRDVLAPLNVKAFDQVYRDPALAGKSIKVPAEVHPEDWTIWLGSDAIELDDVFDAIDALAVHLEEEPPQPPARSH